MNLEALSLLEQISREKGISPETLVEALQSAVAAAAKKRWPEFKEIHSEFNPETGEVEILVEKTVVEDIENDAEEISLKEALKINKKAEPGETLLVKQELAEYGRIAAQLAKQVILQKVREAEIENTYNEFKDKKGDLINGIAQRVERGDLIVDLGKAEGVLPRREQVFRETFNRGERIRAYVVDVRKTPKSAVVVLSRTHTGLVQRLFELEVPEISEGMVEIMGIVREPNGRTKIAVRTNDRDIDAVGACVGMRGMRVQSIVQELRGEKIDIVEYSEDSEVFMRNALSPAKISRIIRNDAEKHMIIIVADDQMSLAIGKKGQNVRLAAKLVKWKVDIKGESEAGSLGDAGTWKTMPAQNNQIDFLDIIKNAKGLGPKIMTILFSNDVVTVQEVVKRDLKGLTALTGIGPKKAELILEIAKLHTTPEPVEEVVEVESAEIEEAGTAVEDDAIVEETQQAVSDATEESIEVEDEDGEEDPDIPITQLANASDDTITTLQDSGFETMAELSVATVEELSEIEGIDESMARDVIEQAKNRVDNLEIS
ncbi:MAG: transcription termination/antitermination protein NusA [Candidatus Nitrohelix vancouverensis]|uniref:Transcription termination/antitermination protein NusA n=1 Tax=Candidatus Nitrohelix vancouverensis TaxID=2705534 RepID=A0A7T0C4E1_9BACT|nr:MAG: transcription termination/antitermination protein NusA [Candidatus Nitrohelix vancouverensis]